MIPTIEFVSLQLFDDSFTAELFLLARVLFGGMLAFTGLNHFLDRESMADFAEAKGVPAPTLSVIASGVVLVAGGLGIALGVFPALAAAALAVFLFVTTPMMHDFWAVPETQKQTEMTSFLKNVGLFAGALVVFVVSAIEWPYALGGSVF